LLVTQGVAGIKVAPRGWLDRLAAACSGDGRALGPVLLAEIRREAERLMLIERQIKQVEAAQHRALQEDTALATGARALKCLKGIGETFSSGLMHEAFWRDFQNRRQVGGSFGLVPWPWDSGDVHRDQPISKVGNRRARTLAIECAWMWVHHQPDSALKPLVAGALRPGQQAPAQDRHRRPGPQADGGAVALSDTGPDPRRCGAQIDTAPSNQDPGPIGAGLCTGWGRAAAALGRASGTWERKSRPSRSALQKAAFGDRLEAGTDIR
jgi:hypothetical protein